MERTSSVEERDIPIVRDRPLYDAIKRVIDVFVAVVGMVVFFPLWLLFAVLIKLTSAGPVFYVTDSVGKDAELFQLYKFRTMRADSGEADHDHYLEEFVNGKPYTVVKGDDGREKKVYKIIDDDRVTTIGRFLRSTGLDEAPQFINVLKGEMSVVGPRSPRPAEYAHYKEWHKERLTILPGITGLYQVTARSGVPFDEMVRIDLEYVSNRSLWLDLKIMALTPINIFILRKGGY